MSRQELRRRLLLAEPTARDEDMTYGPECGEAGDEDKADGEADRADQAEGQG